ncbi:hypothetical protein F7202_00490 [Helicobacter pylori]|nr:hypothetical protein [Helicobacter pylori]
MKKSYISRKKLPMEKIQLTYKSQLAPFNFIPTTVQIPPTPFLVISDLTSFFKFRHKTPSIQGFLSELFAQRIQDSV